MVDLDNLNAQFAIADQLLFKPGPGQLPVVEIENRFATATIALYGGHVLAFQPRGQQPVIWTSRHSQYEVGRAIRGGIPVCWPWFAMHPSDATKPSHGFVRTMLWQVAATRVVAGATQLTLALTDSEASLALWPHSFRLELIVTVGAALEVDLVARNTGSRPFSVTGALHSYFAVSDIRQARIHGLEGCAYLDKVDAFRRKVQPGPVVIAGEIDRIYLDTTAECVIEDPGWRRRIHIAKAGSRSTVVWNPWQERARALPDFGAEAFMEMVCVETANAAEDVITIAPGGAHRLGAVIAVD
jgi:D-hexose-6-phosphate mutarotase